MHSRGHFDADAGAPTGRPRRPWHRSSGCARSGSLVISTDVAYRERALDGAVRARSRRRSPSARSPSPTTSRACCTIEPADVVVLDATGCETAAGKVIATLAEKAPRTGVVVVCHHCTEAARELRALPKWGWTQDLRAGVELAYRDGNPLATGPLSPLRRRSPWHAPGRPAARRLDPAMHAQTPSRPSIAARAAAAQAADCAGSAATSAQGISLRSHMRRSSATPAARPAPRPSRGLVDDPADRRVDRLGEHHLQPRPVQRRDRVRRPRGGAERPHEDRDVLQRVAQRPDDIGIADPALRPGPLDARAAGLVARDRAHRVTVGDEVLGEAAGRGSRRR